MNARGPRRLLRVSVRARVPITELPEEDKGVEGIYQVNVPAGLADAEAASIALDTFHETQPIGELDPFEISVFDEGGRPLSGDPNHEDYSKGHLGGGVAKVSNTPVAPRISLTLSREDAQVVCEALTEYMCATAGDGDEELAVSRQAAMRVIEVLNPLVGFRPNL